MKLMIIVTFGLFVTMGYSQSNDLNEVNKLINSFETEKNIEDLEKAETMLNEMFADKAFRPDLESLKTKSKVLSLSLLNRELEDPLSYSQDVQKAYSAALEKDEKMTYRYTLLNDLYTAKIKMMEMGNDAYADGQHSAAHSHYKNALSMNDLELAYPKHARQDTSLIFTAAVFATLAKKNKEAISDFEELLSMEYKRAELYDYLARLYEEEGMTEKATNILKLKEERHPTK